MKKKIIMVTVLPVFIFFMLLTTLPMGSNVDLFEEILTKTRGNVDEYGITAVFTTTMDREDIVYSVLNNLGFSYGWNTSVVENDEIYCMEFGKNNVKGYIETAEYENHNIITVSIVKYDHQNCLKELKSKLQESIGDNYIGIKYYEYLKCKVEISDINLINEQLIDVLKSHKAVDINTIAIENGYSTTAYTKQYDPIRNNGKLIDFNYAVCKYSSGNYIIIGTPELIVTY